MTEDSTTATHSVTENCVYSAPVMPGMNDTGTNTASSTSVVATTGPVTSRIAWRVAARASCPVSAMMRCTFSTTTMLSSTTTPMARRVANRVIMLAENPSA